MCVAASARAEVNVAVEISFTTKQDYRDPFNEIVLDATFTDPTGKTFRVPVFWAGGNVWKVRYASPRTGVHRYRTECNSTADTGLHGVEGQVDVVPYNGRNPFYQHGPVRIAPTRRYFEHADGTPFFWLGDTWWMGLCHRLQWPDEFKTLTADRAAKGFNVIQIVAGLYPDMPAFDPRGANEAGFPWDTNYVRIRPEYFDAADRRLAHLVENGMTPCIVGAWGYFLQWMGIEKAKQHWRYLIARYGAWPVMWCAAGEANLPWYLVKGFPFEARDQVEGWTTIMRMIRQTDAFGRPLSIHPTGMGRLSARGSTTDEALLDYDMLQTGHGMREVLKGTVDTVRASYAAKPVMPVLNSEVCFEMLNDNIPAEIPRLMFWASVLSGAAGHTYGANGIWQCNRRDQPHGASPHGGNYGKISWDEAMKLPGSQQVGWGKQFLERYQWRRFEPHADWATWSRDSAPRHWGSWIWFPEGDPKIDAPVEPRFFRRTFELPADSTIKQARLFASADDRFTAWVNGKKVATHNDWRVAAPFDIKSSLKPGRNLLAMRAENMPANVKQNPAGLMACLEVELEGGKVVTVLSDSDWRVSKTDSQTWRTIEFDDANWPQAALVAEYGACPWGKVRAGDQAIVPFAAGIGDQSVIIYVPDPNPIKVQHLRPSAKYRAISFDPVTGKRAQLKDAETGQQGALELQPTSADHDWVVALEVQ